MQEQWEIHWKDYYKILGLSHNATFEEIKTAYINAVKEHASLSSDEDYEAMATINEAYDTLRNPEKRAKYDKTYKVKMNTIVLSNGNKLASLEGTIDGIPDIAKKVLKWTVGGSLVVAGTALVVWLFKTSDKEIKPTISPEPSPEPSATEFVESNPTEEPLKVGDDELVIENPTTVKPKPTTFTQTVVEKQPTASEVIPSATPEPSTEVTPTVTPKPTPEATPTPMPSATPEPEPAIDPDTENQISTAAQTVAVNWQSHGANYDIDTIKEVIKCVNGLPSELSIEKVDEIIENVIELAVTPGINNAFAGEKMYSTRKIDISGLMVTDKSGYGLVNAMQLHLNGILTDSDNMIIYGERAFVDEAIILELGQSIDNVSLNSGNPMARLLWARLAIGTNGILGSLGDDLYVSVDGNIYGQSELNDASILESVVRNAKVQLGEESKTLSLK